MPPDIEIVRLGACPVIGCEHPNGCALKKLASLEGESTKLVLDNGTTAKINKINLTPAEAQIYKHCRQVILIPKS